MIKSKKKTSKKQKIYISTPVNFSNLLPGSSNREHHNRKNHEAPFPNQSNGKGWNWRKNNYTKGFITKKITIKIMNIKIKIKNKLEKKYKFLIEEWN